MKILITGGHMTPALAVIQKLPTGTEVTYVGRKFALEGDSALSLEYQTINSMGIPFVEFQPARLQRKFTKYTLPSLTRIPKDVAKAWTVLRKEKPDVVLSFGGHVALPFGIACSMLRTPLVIHEQTLEIGITNKLLKKFATKICVSWESSLEFFPKNKTVLTGNPIPSYEPSEEMQHILEKAPKKYPLLTITGGSLGSHPVNALVEPIIQKLLAKYTVLHQTGDAKEYGDFERLSGLKSSLPYTFQERFLLQKFISPSDMSYIYSSSDVVVSRSGINTVLMLLLQNIPSLLIPLPFSQRHEQEKNALLLKSVGLGEVFRQDILTSESLFEAIESMMEKKSTYTNARLGQMQALHANAAEKVLQVVYGTQNHALQKEA